MTDTPMPTPWFCPRCQAHHAPWVLTCPNGGPMTTGIGWPIKGFTLEPPAIVPGVTFPNAAPNHPLWVGPKGPLQAIVPTVFARPTTHLGSTDA